MKIPTYYVNGERKDHEVEPTVLTEDAVTVPMKITTCPKLLAVSSY